MKRIRDCQKQKEAHRHLDVTMRINGYLIGKSPSLPRALIHTLPGMDV